MEPFIAGLLIGLGGGGAVVWLYAARIKKAKDAAEEALRTLKAGVRK